MAEEEQNWFWRIRPLRRETALMVAALLLIAAPLLLFNWSASSCGRTRWFLPLGELLGGATIFGFAAFLPTRGIGCLAMILAFPMAFGVWFCVSGRF